MTVCEIRFAIEEAVRLGLTAFAPTVIAQLGLINEKEALRRLYDFTLAHPGELDCYRHIICPECRAEVPTLSGLSTTAGDWIKCNGCPLIFRAADDDLHWMFEPCGTLAVPIERWHEVRPTPRSRPSALAERVFAC